MNPESELFLWFKQPYSWKFLRALIFAQRLFARNCAHKIFYQWGKRINVFFNFRIMFLWQCEMYTIYNYSRLYIRFQLIIFDFRFVSFYINGIIFWFIKVFWQIMRFPPWYSYRTYFLQRSVKICQLLFRPMHYFQRCKKLLSKLSKTLEVILKLTYHNIVCHFDYQLSITMSILCTKSGLEWYKHMEIQINCQQNFIMIICTVCFVRFHTH